MNKKQQHKLKKILGIIAWSGIVLSLMVVMGFVNHSRKQAKCSGINISMDYSDGLFFIDEDDVRNHIYKVHGDLIGEPMRGINIGDLEIELTEMNAVKKAEVFTDLKGNLSVEITQRKPIARVFMPDGKSGYIDENGQWMNLSKKFTARVIVINGNLSPRNESVDNIGEQDQWGNLFELTQSIRNDAFLSAQFEQIYVKKDGDIVLIPRVGRHNILLGNTDGLNKKFEKLKLFYKNGIANVDWNKYKQIDLRFKDQVVCTKR
jgi:cell division protein FtsQ